MQILAVFIWLVDVFVMSKNLTRYKYSLSGFGLACHIGVLANLPTIGVGKNVSHKLILTFLITLQNGPTKNGNVTNIK